MAQSNDIIIRRYTPEDDGRLFALIEREGEGWKDYWREGGRAKYQKALASSIAYLLFENETLCAYIRCRDDDGYGVYIYDLLTGAEHRGKSCGRLLMEHVREDFPDNPVYIMCDKDAYYEKLGYERMGSVFMIKKRGSDAPERVPK